MGKVLSNLVVGLGASTDGLLSGLKTGYGAISSFSAKIESTFSSAGSSILKFSGIGAAIGTIAGGAGFGLLLTNQMEAIDTSAKLSDRLGITTESLGGLQHAADLAGVSSEALTGGLEKYLKNVAGAAGGNKDLSAAFTSLGLDAKQLINLPTDQAVGKIGDALNGVKNPAQRAAAEVAIFGKAGQGLAPLLATGSQGIADMTADAAALGLTFSRVDAGKVEAANDAVSRIGGVTRGVFNQLAIAAAPAIESVANAVTNLGIGLVTTIKTYLPTVIGWFSSAWTSVVALTQSILGPIVTWISDNLGQIVDYVSQNIAVTYSYLANIFEGIYSLVVSTVSNVGAALQAVGISTGTAGGAFSWLRQTIMDSMTVIGFVIKNWELSMGIVGLSVAATVVTIGNQIEYVFTEVIPAILTWFGQNWSNILTDVFNLTTSVFENIGKNVVSIMSNLPGLISGSVSFADLWTPLTDGFKTSLSDLPKIADRQIGALEGQLNSDLAQEKGKFADGLARAISDQDQLAQSIAANIKGAVKTAVATFPTVPNSPTNPIGTDATATDPTAQDKKEKEAKHSQLSEGTNIASGSAQSLALMNSILPSDSEAKAASPEAETPKAVRDAADKYQPTQITLLQAIVDRLDRLVNNNGGTTTVQVGDDD